MISTTVTEKDPVRKKLLAAMDRLLDGKPLRSTGRLSVSQLAVEAGVGRWQLTHQHLDLKELFQARVKAAVNAAGAGEPGELEKLRAEYADLRRHCAELEAQVQLYAGVINLLALERHTADSAAAVTDLESARRRRTRTDGDDIG
ncbi:hypothetical protein AB4305_16825 [Nocardia sp. 2YAB30]|uniref:hypothetical protein n=1 Tax=unclassified Nocardia TaxID=2637762 RepID=UPI003F9ABEFE